MMRLAAGLPLVLSAHTASAEIADLPDPARAALERRVETMETAVVAKDAAAMFDLLPPPVVALMATSVGRPTEEFRLLFIDNLEFNRPGTGVESLELDLSAASLFSGDEGRVYALIPTESLAFDPYRGRFQISATTVAIPSGETWHFFTVSDTAAQAMIVAAYPALAAAPLAPATLTPAP
jgi:hypothetical protein